MCFLLALTYPKLHVSNVGLLLQLGLEHHFEDFVNDTLKK